MNPTLVCIMVVLLCSSVLGTLNLASAADIPTQAEDEKSIRQSVASYVDAFNRHDAKAVANLETPIR